MGINPRVLASVTSETPGFRGEGCELSQEKQKLAAHIYWLMKSAARSLQLHSNYTGTRSQRSAREKPDHYNCSSGEINRFIIMK